MIRGNTEILFKWNLILIVLFLFSCKEDKSLVLNPLDNIDYEFKIFFLDESDDSGTGTFRMEGENSGLSSRLYVGNIIENIEEEGSTSNKKSYIYLKIKNELIKNNIFCSESVIDLNNVQLKLPTITDTEHLHSSQYFDYAPFKITHTLGLQRLELPPNE